MTTDAAGPRDLGMCKAEEWHRDGRGCWAMRFCYKAQGHGDQHNFVSWRLYVQPPSVSATAERGSDWNRLDATTGTPVAADSKEWCETCTSWRYTMPCGRDECPAKNDTPGCDCDASGNRDAGYHASDCNWRRETRAGLNAG
jgi:hypothetical protein